MAFLVALKSNPTGKFESHQHSNFNNRSFETKQKKSNLRYFFCKTRSSKCLNHGSLAATEDDLKAKKIFQLCCFVNCASCSWYRKMTHLSWAIMQSKPTSLLQSDRNNTLTELANY